MNTWIRPRNLATRLSSMYLQLREAALGHLDRDLSRHEEGQGMIEYALILVLIAVVVVLILSTVGTKVTNMFSNVSNGLNA